MGPLCRISCALLVLLCRCVVGGGEAPADFGAPIDQRVAPDLAIDPDLPTDDGPTRDQMADAPPCPTTWRADLPGPINALRAGTDGTAVAVGRSGNSVLLARVERCGAQQTVEYLPAGASAAAARGLLLVDGDLIAVGWVRPGSDTQDGLLVRAAQRPLTIAQSVALTGPGGTAEALTDVVSAGGGLWVGGSVDDTVLLGLRVAPDDSACGFTVATGGLGRRLLVAGSEVYLVGNKDGLAYLARYQADDCGGSPCPGSCSPPWELDFQDGANDTVGTAAVEAGGALYVVGFSSVGGVLGRGLVARIDVSAKNVETLQPWNPSSSGDAIYDVTTDGQALYLAGTTEKSDQTPGRAALIKLSLPGLTTVWQRVPGDPGAYRSIALDGAGGVLVGGGTDDSGVIRRCTTDGDCS